MNKVAHKLGTASQGRDAVPFEVAVRLGWHLPCLPGDRRFLGRRSCLTAGRCLGSYLHCYSLLQVTFLGAFKKQPYKRQEHQ